MQSTNAFMALSIGKLYVHHHLYKVMQSFFAALSIGEDCFVLLIHSEEYPPQKDFE